MNDHSPKRTWDEQLFIALWVWLGARTLLPWLVFFRLTFEGDSYRWQTFWFGQAFWSSGLSRPDFLLIYGLLGIGAFLMFALRRYRFKVAAPVLVSYFGLQAADALFELASGEPLIFSGETLGVNINVTTLYSVLAFIMFGLAIAWWVGIRDGALNGKANTLTGWRRWTITLCILAVPLQLWLLVSGPPDGVTDQAGVLITLAQGVLLIIALYPGADYRGNSDAGTTVSLSAKTKVAP